LRGQVRAFVHISWPSRPGASEHDKSVTIRRCEVCGSSPSLAVFQLRFEKLMGVWDVSHRRMLWAGSASRRSRQARCGWTAEELRTTRPRRFWWSAFQESVKLARSSQRSHLEQPALLPRSCAARCPSAALLRPVRVQMEQLFRSESVEIFSGALVRPGDTRSYQFEFTLPPELAPSFRGAIGMPIPPRWEGQEGTDD